MTTTPSPGSSSPRSPPRPRTRLWLAARQIAPRARAPRRGAADRSPARSRSPRTRRRPTTPSPRRASAMVDVCCSARAACSRSRSAACCSGSSDAWARVARAGRHRARRGADRLGGAAARRCSSCRSTLYRTFVRRGALRLQPHDAGAVRRRPRQAGAAVGALLGVPLLLAVLWLMAQHGRAVVALGLGRLDRLQPAGAADLPDASSRRCSTSSRPLADAGARRRASRRCSRAAASAPAACT